MIAPRLTLPAVLLVVLMTWAVGTAHAAKPEQDLLGLWTLVSFQIERDGVRTDAFGPGARGTLTFDASGRFSLTIIGAGLPKFAANSRDKGTPEENQAVLRGSIAYFGSFSVSTTEPALLFHLDAATYPNWDGTDQKRPYTLTGDELRWVNRAPSGGSGTGTLVWKRVK
jgi:hypothetical protein